MIFYKNCLYLFGPSQQVLARAREIVDNERRALDDIEQVPEPIRLAGADNHGLSR